MESRYYKHFKGKPYEFLYEARHTETLEELVVYRALYGERKVWVRPRDMFFGDITRDGYSGRRFIPISEEEALSLSSGI